MMLRGALYELAAVSIALWDEWTPAAQSDLLTAAEAAVRAYLAAAVPTDGKTLSREFDEDGRALCFQCGEPQSAHPDGEECEGREYARGFAAGRAAATPDPPTGDPHDSAPWDDDWQEQEAMIGTALPAASPDERLREALTDALEGMLDMRPYVPDYFAEKWDHDGYIERARAALEWRPLAAADREKPPAGSDGEDR